ncbi:hypothetical protein COCNU_03G016470 [Cocos nucifera]|uniref:Uncharacterized protein n=1 Tax=Cocos nucifera TaxID=13894 RepID=A0A8K0I4D9_COCNU|nr:hypothetical protein COCNU_03G016470 [Cocos nucifera]
MLAVVERDSSFRPLPSPSPSPSYEMPLRHLAKDPARGEKHVVSKKPFQNSINQQQQQQLESHITLPVAAKKSSGRRRGRGRAKVAAESPLAKPEMETGVHAGPPVSSRGIGFLRRPGFGQVGTKCIVKANHFLAELPDKDLIQYDVAIAPEVSSRSMNRAIMAELVRLYRETELGMRLPAYDGRKSLYTAGFLPFDSKEFAVKIAEEDDGIGVTRKPHRLGDGLQSWCGFYQSIRPTQMGLSLNIDMSSTAFIEPLPVIEFVAQILGKDVLSRPLSDADRIKIKKALRGVKVEVTHRGNVRRKYRISGLTSQPTRELIFPVDDQMNMKSVVEYFKEMYGFTIQYSHLPCLQVGNQKKANYLPMEACKIVEGQRYTKRLNEKQITSLLKVTCQRPREQEIDILQCCLTKHVFKVSKQYLANVSLKINVKMGGRNTVLLDAISWRIPLVSDIPTIIFGADVTHPETGEDSSPSIAAVVASQDWPEVTKYAGLVCAQAHRQELIQDLYKTWHDPQRGTVTGGMIRELLISFRKATGQKPLRIIFYRDGVSEGQFYQVLLYELDAIRKACASLEPNYQPLVTFVVVQKRHHTRLFANNHRDRSSTDKSGNILPVPPAYYAHLAAFRARFYMEPEISENSASRSTRTANGSSVRPLPALKEKVKRVMFYC